MERSGATSASTTRGGRREDSVPDERAKPKWHFIRFLPPLADIKLNLFQFDLSRVTTEILLPLYAHFTTKKIEDLSIGLLSGQSLIFKLILVKNGKILSWRNLYMYVYVWEYFVESWSSISFFKKRFFFSKSIQFDGFSCD